MNDFASYLSFIINCCIKKVLINDAHDLLAFWTIFYPVTNILLGDLIWE